jgi:hypothetical protein
MSNTFAIKEVMDFTVETYSASGRGNLLFYVDYAGNTTINTTAERLDIRGGQGNFKLISLDHTKDTMFNSMLPLVDVNALATKLGVSVTEGAATASITETLTADGSNQITLSHEPLANTLKIHKLAFERDLSTEQTAGTPASTPNEYSISTKTVTLNSTTAPSGTKFIVSYEYTSGTAAQNIKITASDFPNFITIRGRGLADDDQEGQKIPVSFKIHKAKVQQEFELTMEGTSATELAFNCDCYTIINSNGDREYLDVVVLQDESY